jgi:tRNA acetyltransferase TAN1
MTNAAADNCQNLMGMSVVESDYDKLKRYNLAEIYDPSPRKAEKADTSGIQAKS